MLMGNCIYHGMTDRRVKELFGKCHIVLSGVLVVHQIEVFGLVSGFHDG